MGPNTLKRWLENECKLLRIFRFLRLFSLISKDQTENIICTMDDVRGNILRPPRGTTPAAVIGNKNKVTVCIVTYLPNNANKIAYFSSSAENGRIMHLFVMQPDTLTVFVFFFVFFFFLF